MTAVLVVEADAELRDRWGDWLEERGFEVLTCPGPGGPDAPCVAGRGLPCTLAGAADVIVLDLWLAPDTVLEGSGGEQLRTYYAATRTPLVTISHRRRPPPDGEREVRLSWPPSRTALLDAVLALVPRNHRPRMAPPSL